MKITLITGKLEVSENMDGFEIVSTSAVAEGLEDVDLRKGDFIDVDGKVWRDDEVIAEI